MIGIFRRTSSGSYFYQYPCAMNEWAFFYTALALLLYIPQLSSAAVNTYYSVVRKISSFHVDSIFYIKIRFDYISTLHIVVFVFAMVNSSLKDNIIDHF